MKDLDFPADKQTIVTFVEKLNSPQSREILPVIEKLNEKRYESVSEVANATGLLKKQEMDLNRMPSQKS